MYPVDFKQKERSLTYYPFLLSHLKAPIRRFFYGKGERGEEALIKRRCSPNVQG